MTAGEAVVWLLESLGMELDPWQESVLRRVWDTLPDEVEGGPAMTHTANESDQFTPMNTDGQVGGLPHVPHYGGPQVGDQPALVNPSVGDQGAPGGGVNPMGPAPVIGQSATTVSTRQVYPDTSVGTPN